MYGLLVAALIAAAIFLWIRRGVRPARAWNQLVVEAQNAAERHDYAAAQCQLETAEALAAQRGGMLAPMRRQAVQALRAQVLYRAGELERASALAFDQLQQARAVT